MCKKACASQKCEPNKTYTRQIFGHTCALVIGTKSWFLNSPTSHLSPTYPGGQEHSNRAMRLVHVPLFWHGDERHSFTSTT